MAFDFETTETSVAATNENHAVSATVTDVMDLVSGDGRESAFEVVEVAGTTSAAVADNRGDYVYETIGVDDDDDSIIDYVSDQTIQPRTSGVGYPDFPTTDEGWKAKFDAEDEHKKELKDAEKEVLETTVLQAQAEEQLKLVKAQAKAATKELRRLINRGPDYAAFDPKKKEKQQQEESQEITETEEYSSQEEGASGEEKTGESKPNNDWRGVLVGELQIKKSILEKLYAADVETIGELVDLQGDISNRKAKWPKGIGEAKVTELEDALTVWLTKNRDSHLFN